MSIMVHPPFGWAGGRPARRTRLPLRAKRHTRRGFQGGLDHLLRNVRMRGGEGEGERDIYISPLSIVSDIAGTPPALARFFRRTKGLPFPAHCVHESRADRPPDLRACGARYWLAGPARRRSRWYSAWPWHWECRRP